MRASGAISWLLAAAIVTTVAAPARAQDGVAFVGEVVNVIDAFDGEDSFDFTFRARYSFELTRTKLTQQCSPTLPAGATIDGGECVPARNGLMGFRTIGRSTRERHLLNLDAVFGIFRDLELYLTVPLVLLDRRQIDYHPEGPQANLPGNESLFRFPFDSADRSGIDQIYVGLSWLPFSQERESTLPNWLISIEGRFAVGDAMRPACAGDRNDAVLEPQSPGTDATWFTADDVRDPASGDCRLEADADDEARGGPGISERTNDLRVRMTLSRRYGVVEPYIGFLLHLMFPEEGDPRYGNASDLPLYAETHFGFEIVPWEQAERQQFFRIGLHAWGGWTSETLYRGVLFDLLGTNPNMAYDYDPVAGRAACDASGTDATMRDCDPSNPNDANAGRGERDSRSFNGMTREEGRGTFGGRLTLSLQAARFVKFAFGLGLAYDQEHFITFTDECRAARGDESGDPTGPCGPPVSGIFVEEHRAQIDDMGFRLRAEQTMILDAFAMVFIQF
jgi:hypothetical protein